MLNINIQNLGNIKKADICLNKLTIFGGENNSGKTYINYLLYALLDKKNLLKSNIYKDILNIAKEKGVYEIDILDFIDKNFEKLKSKFEKHFVLSLDRFFSV